MSPWANVYEHPQPSLSQDLDDLLFEGSTNFFSKKYTAVVTAATTKMVCMVLLNSKKIILKIDRLLKRKDKQLQSFLQIESLAISSHWFLV